MRIITAGTCQILATAGIGSQELELCIMVLREIVSDLPVPEDLPTGDMCSQVFINSKIPICTYTHIVTGLTHTQDVDIYKYIRVYTYLEELYVFQFVSSRSACLATPIHVRVRAGIDISLFSLMYMKPCAYH